MRIALRPCLMSLQEKRDLAAQLSELSPQPMSPRIGPTDAPDRLNMLLRLLDERRKAIVVDTYVEHLSSEELAQLVRFYQSDLGRSLVRTWTILDERMRQAFPTLARDAAREAGLSDAEMSGPLNALVSDRSRR